MKEEKSKSLSKIYWIIGAIFALPIAVALIIIIAVKFANPYSSKCEYNGKEYLHLETFASKDGCNTCTCNNGIVSCTEMACIPIEESQDVIIGSEEDALSLVKEQQEVIDWLNSFTVNGGTKEGSPEFTVLHTPQSESYTVEAKDSLTEITYNYYYVSYDGTIRYEYYLDDADATPITMDEAFDLISSQDVVKDFIKQDTELRYVDCCTYVVKGDNSYWQGEIVELVNKDTGERVEDLEINETYYINTENGQISNSIDLISDEESNSKITEDEALEIVKNLPEVQEWLEKLTNNPKGSEVGKPSLGISEDIKENCKFYTKRNEDCYVVQVYESLSGHNATHGWYYVTFDGEVFSEF